MSQLNKGLNSLRRFKYYTTLHYTTLHCTACINWRTSHFFSMHLCVFDLLPEILHIICNISWNYTYNQNIRNIRARLLHGKLNIFCNGNLKWHANSVSFNTPCLFLFPKFPTPVITFFYCINETWNMTYILWS